MVLGRWRRELRRKPEQAFGGNGRSRDEELSQVRRELARVTKEREFFARSGSVLRESVGVKFGIIQRCRDAFPIRLMCWCLRVSASGYYGWATRPPSVRTTENARLVRRMHDLHTLHDGVIGSPRMWEELRYAGERCGRHRVARLMRRAGLQGVPQRRRWRRKASGLPPVGTQNHLERDFTASAPNTKWVTDITYIRGRALVVSLHRAGFVFRPCGRLVDEPAAGPPTCGAGGVDGGVAAAGPHAGHSPFRSRLPVYLGGVPAILGGAPRHVQHERRRQLCR
jgi:helix-turn-helix protein